MPRKTKEINNELNNKEVIDVPVKKTTKKASKATTTHKSKSTDTTKTAKSTQTKSVSTSKTTKSSKTKSTSTSKTTKTSKSKSASASKTIKNSKTKSDSSSKGKKSINKNLPLKITSKALKINETKEKGIAKSSTTQKELTVISQIKRKYSKAERTREDSLEYYDLPYNYNETIVKILAQTPKKLFVYWDVSLNDIENYKKVFGDDFFYTTYPVLIVHNENKNYSFEIPVNDFANSWYIDIDDSKCKYSIDFGRKFKNNAKILNPETFESSNINLQNDYLFITNSNKIESPNDHILFENYNLFTNIRYKNVKTNEITIKKLVDLPIVHKYGELNSNLNKIYNEIYGLNDLPMETFFDLANPSSGNPSSRI